MPAPVIGIDLGTTNACCAVADDDGHVTLIPYRGGEFTIPSIFAIDEKGHELIGYEAKRQWQLNPRNTVFGSKRLMGQPYNSPLVDQMREHASYEIVEGPPGEVSIPLSGKLLALPEIASKFLGKAKQVASEHLKMQITQAVVTVPAYYNDRQRQAVRRAGRLADLEILHIINEPTAAAIAFGARDKRHQCVVVYDLGGGTFDVSVIQIRDRVFEVKATGGDIFLGGIDFDNALIQYVLNEFAARHHIDLTQDPVAMQRLRDVGERAKIDLSSRGEAPLSVPFITMTHDGKPLDVELNLTRGDVEALVEPMIDRTFQVCEEVIRAAGLRHEQIDEVILVGGQTRMPLVQARIEAFFGKQASKQIHPDEAVAIGAALFAWSLNDRTGVKYQLLDVIPMAIGIEEARGRLHTLFERYTPVPNRRQFTFTTHRDHQKDLIMRIRQGDAAQATANTLLGEFQFEGIRPGPAGSVQVEVVFDLTSEGILRLEAKDVDTGVAMKQSVSLNH